MKSYLFDTTHGPCHFLMSGVWGDAFAQIMPGITPITHTGLCVKSVNPSDRTRTVASVSHMKLDGIENILHY